MVDESKVLQAVEVAKNTGKVRIGTNETTKAVERGIAKLVVFANDVDPKEVVMHLNPLCDEKKIVCTSVASKQDLGRAVGLKVSTAAVAVVEVGDAKKQIEEIAKG